MCLHVVYDRLRNESAAITLRSDPIKNSDGGVWKNDVETFTHIRLLYTRGVCRAKPMRKASRQNGDSESAVAEMS